MTLITMPCSWCEKPVAGTAGCQAIQCPHCKHWFYTPWEEEVPRMVKCVQCERYSPNYGDPVRKVCLLCLLPPI